MFFYKILIRVLLPALLLGLTMTSNARPDSNKKTKVVAGRVKQETFTDIIEALGSLKANETTTLSANVTETVKAIHFTDGQQVKQGEILVEMNSLEENAQLVYAKAEVKEAEQQYARARRLSKTGAVSKALLDERQRQLDTAGARMQEVLSKVQDRQIIAPFDGVLGLRQVSVGTLIKPGDAIITINDNSKMKLDFPVPSIYLGKLKIGQDIKASSRTYPNLEFAGNVVSMDNAIDPVTRSILVRALIPNPESLLKSGILMQVKLKTKQHKAVGLAEEAIMQNGEKYFVFVIDEQDKTVSRRELIIGTRKPGIAEVVSGLDVGELVVLHGGFKLADGKPVEFTLSGEQQNNQQTKPAGTKSKVQ